MSERFRLRRLGLEWRTIDGEVVALDLPTEMYLGINRSGSSLWHALATGATEQELVQLLVSEYSIDRADAERDVRHFIWTLKQRGVIESEPE